MITWEDLNPKKFDLTEEQKNNLISLSEKLTKLETAFGSLFKISSGFRSILDHYRIYKEMGISTPPLGSQHLKGNAADIYDPRKTLKDWVLSEKGLQKLEELGLYCEELEFTPRWVHFQQIPPVSNKRFFIPFSYQ